MKSNLDNMRAQIQEHLESRGIAVFHGFCRAAEDSSAVYWDSEHFPDFRAFLAAAEAAGVRLVALHSREFTEDIIDDAAERIEEAPISRDDRRELEKSLGETRVYLGFTCQIELSFDLNARTYIFDLRTPWFDEFNDLLDRIDDAFDESEDDNEPLGGGYFSKN